MNIITKLKYARKEGERIFNDILESDIDITTRWFWADIGRSQIVCEECKKLYLWCKNVKELDWFLKKAIIRPRQLKKLAKFAKKNNQLFVLNHLRFNNLPKFID